MALETDSLIRDIGRQPSFQRCPSLHSLRGTLQTPRPYRGLRLLQTLAPTTTPRLGGTRAGGNTAPLPALSRTDDVGCMGRFQPTWPALEAGKAPPGGEGSLCYSNILLTTCLLCGETRPPRTQNYCRTTLAAEGGTNRTVKHMIPCCSVASTSPSPRKTVTWLTRTTKRGRTDVLVQHCVLFEVLLPTVPTTQSLVV